MEGESGHIFVGTDLHRSTNDLPVFLPSSPSDQTTDSVSKLTEAILRSSRTTRNRGQGEGNQFGGQRAAEHLSMKQWVVND